MLNKLWIALFGMALFFACKNEQTQESATSPSAVNTPKVITHKLIQKWETDTLLKVPESVLFDAKNKVLYVSNIEGTDPWAADGKGSIGKIGLDGKIILADWIKGLQAPKGMAIFQDKLYVADLTNIVVIDIATGNIERIQKIGGAKGLNDIAIDASGVIYATDSEGKQLFKIEGNSPVMLLDSLAGPNGILVNGKDIYVLNNGGMYKFGNNRSMSLIADGMEGGTDGIESATENDFIVSCWAGAIWYLNGDGRKELLFDGKAAGKNTADIGYDPVTKTVYVPTFWKNSVIAFELKEN